ncbi:MAG TPA: HlyC/CorC family transporter, partial [Terriglobales bacterium]
MSVIALPIVLMLGVLTLVSYVERLYTEIGKFLSREFQDNIDVFEQRVEPRLKVSRSRAALSMAVLTQLSMAAIALMVGYAVFHEKGWNTPEIIQATISLVLIVIVCNRLLPFVFFSRTKGTWLVSLVPLLRLLIYVVMPVTLVIGFCQSVASLTREHAE